MAEIEVVTAGFNWIIAMHASAWWHLTIPESIAGMKSANFVVKVVKKSFNNWVQKYPYLKGNRETEWEAWHYFLIKVGFDTSRPVVIEC